MKLNFLDRGFGVNRGPAALALAGVQAVGSIYGGVSAEQAANQEASLQQQQGNIALQESQVNANNEAFNQTQAVQNQRLAFLANGVSLEGSPSLVLAQSKAYGQTQVNSILNQGAAQYNLAQEEAQITKNQGRAALISGILGAGSAAVKGYSSGTQAGLFNTGSGEGVTG
jgi:hypothetical protein